MDKSITIYNVQGETILTTPVKADSKRAFELMNHDYIKLLFSLYTPVSIPLGAYCDTDFGRFELTDLYNPAYNTSTGGYDYELQLDAQYRKWKNKIFKYRPAYGGQEASWSLTASLDVQMNVFLDNLKALGYTYNDTAKSDYVVEISTDVENTAKAMSYSNTSLLDALTSLANTWECEWWITGNVIHFGKAKSGTPVELVIGGNVENMEPSDSRDTYATRIYPFGSTRNLSSKYRKDLIFDITNGGTVRDVTVGGTEYLGIDVYDQARPVYADFFPESERKETKVSPFTSDLNGGSRVDDFDDFSNTGEYTGEYGILGRREVTIRNKIDFDDSAPGHLSDFYYIESVEFTFIGYRRKGNLEEKLSCSIKNMKLVYPEGSGRADIDITDTVLKGKRVKFYKTQTCIPDIVTTLSVGIDISQIAEISKPFREVITFWPQGTFRSAAHSVVCEAVTVSGVNAGKTYKCIVNPKFVVEADTYDRNEMYFLLQGGSTSDMPDKGDRFTLTKIQRFLTPSSYFTDATPGDVTKAGVVERRLMLPKGIPYVPYIENDTTPQEQIVEAVAVFDDIYPKREGTVSAVSTFTRTDEEEMDDGSKKKTQWEAYVIEDAAFSFDKDWQIEGTTLQFVFSSGLLNGMTFDVNFHPSGWIDPDNTLHDTQCWEIVRNEDYGRPIPDSVLCPKVGDKYVLLNFDSTAIDETGYVEAAEQKLYEEAMKLYNESKEDPSTYTVTMMSDCVYSPDGIHNLLKVGDQVTLKNPAYFPEEGRISRVIGYEFNLDMPYDSPVYTIGNTPKYSRLDAMEEKIDEISYNGGSYVSSGGSSTTGGTSVYVISSTDTDTPRTDKNVYSAKAIDKQAAEAKAEAEDKYLRKDIDDTTPNNLTVEKNLKVGGDTLISGSASVEGRITCKLVLQVGEKVITKEIAPTDALLLINGDAKVAGDFWVNAAANIAGSASIGSTLTATGKVTCKAGVQIGESFIAGILTGVGGFFDQYANGEVESLIIRRFLEVPELRFNRVMINIGDDWHAPGGGLLESVTELTATTGHAKLKLEDGEYGAVEVDDICMGIFHDTTGTKNSTTTSDDGKGNFRFKGFYTVYFRITAVNDEHTEFDYALRPTSSRTGAYGDDGVWQLSYHPCASMNFVGYGNFTKAERQSSCYQTKTYQRFLKEQNTWQIGFNNIAMQTGDLSNMNVFGLDMTGYSTFLQNIYMRGEITRVKLDGTPILTANDRGAWAAGKYDYYDRVSHGGSIWLCVAEGGTSAEPSETNTDWLLQVPKGQDGASGISVTSLGAWHTGLNVPYMGIVTMGGSVFVCKNPNGTTNPPIWTVTGTINGVTKRLKATINGAAVYVITTSNNTTDYDLLVEKPKDGEAGKDGVDGVNGADGKSYEWVFIHTTDKTSPATPATKQEDDYIPDGWHDNAIGVSSVLPYEWTSMRTKVDGVWSSFSVPAIWATYSESPIIADLDNEMDSVACDSSGKTKAQSVLNTNVAMFYGTEKLTLTSIACTAVTGVTYSYNTTTGSITMTVQGGVSIAEHTNISITLKASKDGAEYIRTLTFTLNGVRAGAAGAAGAKGADAVIYRLVPSVSSVIKKKDGTFSVSSVSCTQTKTIGGMTSVSTEMTMKHSIDGGAETAYTSGTAIACTKFSKSVKFALYSGSNVLDVETIPLVVDGTDGANGVDGNSITDVVNYYQVSASSTTAPTSWQTTVPTMTATLKFLWNYEVIKYSKQSDKTSAARIIGVYGEKGATGSKGDKGVGIASVKEYYLASASASGVTTSTSGWTTAMQSTTTTKKYLWNYEVVAYTEGTPYTSTPVIIGTHGEKGDTGAAGRGIVSVTEYYGVSSAQGTQPTSWTTSVPSSFSVANKYLWNKEATVYTDSATAKETAPHIIGVWGATGATGAAGATGNAITAIKEYYLASNLASGVTRSTSGWTTTIQTVSATGKYLWNYTEVNYSKTATTYTDPIIIGNFAASPVNVGDWKTGLYVPYMGITRMDGSSWQCKVEAGTKNPPLFTFTATVGGVVYRLKGTTANGTGYVLNGGKNTAEYALIASDGTNGADGKDGVNGVDGKDGVDGLQGCITRKGKWVAGRSYRNDEEAKSGTRYVDFAMIANSATESGWDAYKCVKSHTATADNSPTSANASTYWEKADASFANLFADTIIAKNASFDFIYGNQITCAKPDGTIECGMTSGYDANGGEVTNIRFWAGATKDNLSNAPFRVNSLGEVYCTELHATGNSTFGGTLVAAGGTFNGDVIAYSSDKDFKAEFNSVEGSKPGLHLYLNTKSMLGYKEIGSLYCINTTSNSGDVRNAVLELKAHIPYRYDNYIGTTLIHGNGMSYKLVNETKNNEFRAPNKSFELTGGRIILRIDRYGNDGVYTHTDCISIDPIEGVKQFTENTKIE